MHPPVRITELIVTGFRNLASVRVVPDPRANVLLGGNGQGKTNLLEAIDYAASLRSFRGATRNQLVGFDTPQAQVLLRVDGPVSGREYRVKISRNAREITLDGKRPERAIDYFGGASCVVFQPGDLDLIRGAPDLRRRLMDRILMRALDGYGEALKSYGRALRSRNQLLRANPPDARAVTAYDVPLTRFGSALVRAREGVVNELVKAAREALADVAHTDDQVELSYRPRASGDPVAYAQAVQAGLATDIARRATQIGPHGDDIAITWNGRPARVVASQGQTRALALALRLAELEVIERRTRSVPVLLLDDVSSELDRDRTERLFARVKRLGAQVWVTTTDPGIAALMPAAQCFHVHEGKLTLAAPHPVSG